MAETGPVLMLSCEHGGNLVPKSWQHLFTGHEALLASHRGYDVGIADFARRLSRQLHAPLHMAEVTRLLVELNRSPGHPRLYSEFSRPLDRKDREALLRLYYHPYRDAVVQHIEQLLTKHERVCHLSLHSFTPVLNGEVRNTDIGLLYDPQRPLEKSFCLQMQEHLQRLDDGWRVRRNYPYRGTMDGFVTLLRRRFPAERYLGLELELNQRWPVQGGERWKTLQRVICDALQLRFP